MNWVYIAEVPVEKVQHHNMMDFPFGVILSSRLKDAKNAKMLNRYKDRDIIVILALYEYQVL